jgi:hypothetical protein
MTRSRPPAGKASTTTSSARSSTSGRASTRAATGAPSAARTVSRSGRSCSGRGSWCSVAGRLRRGRRAMRRPRSPHPRSQNRKRRTASGRPVRRCRGDATFNPWWGCEKVSARLRALLRRHVSNAVRRQGELWGDGHGFRFFGDKHWAEPLKWARLLPAKLGGGRACSARRWPTSSRSGPSSTSPRPALRPDRATPELDWLILTKRPEFARDYSPAPLHGRPRCRTCGSACRSRTPATRGAPTSSARSRRRSGSSAPSRCSAASSRKDTRVVKTIHVLVPGPVDASLEEGPAGRAGLVRAARRERESGARDVAEAGRDLDPAVRGARHRAPLDLSGIDWVIIGGESGPKAPAVPPRARPPIRRGRLRRGYARAVVGAARLRSRIRSCRSTR